MPTEQRCAFCDSPVPAEDLPRIRRSRGRLICLGCAPPPDLDPWIVEGVLGEGGLGLVYAARHKQSGQRAAVKVIKARGEVSEVQLKRFRREAQVLATLDHPHVLPVYGAGNNAGLCWLAMQRAENGSLDRLVRRGPLPLRWAATALGQAARGLAYCHGEGYVHRDVKPANILFDADWSACIGDFGLVRFADTGFSPSALTRPESTTGSPVYMSPEQIENAAVVDPATDVWSLGVSLYEVTTGSLPFGGKTALELFTWIRDGSFQPASSRGFGLPLVLDHLLERILTPDPEQRPTAAQVAMGLERLAEGAAGPLPQTSAGIEQALLERARARRYLSDAELERLREPGETPLLERLREEAGLVPEQLADLDACYRGAREAGGDAWADTVTRTD